MTEADVIELLAELAEVYHNLAPTPDRVRGWCRVLVGADRESVREAARAWERAEYRPPTPADLLRRAPLRLTAPDPVGPMIYAERDPETGRLVPLAEPRPVDPMRDLREPGLVPIAAGCWGSPAAYFAFHGKGKGRE